MSRDIPSYQLYGEEGSQTTEFWLHCESVPERTRLHNWEIAPHRHESFFQIFLLSRGSGAITGDVARAEFQAPCILFIPPGAVHGFSFSRQVDGLVVTALADRLQSAAAGDRRISSFAEAVRIVPLVEAERDAAFAAECVDRIEAELSRHGTGRTMLLEALMTAAIVSLARAGGMAEADVSPVRAPDRRRIEALHELIGAHFREHRPAGFYAERLGLSTAQLNRVCRRETGLSPYQLMARRLIDAARRDLVFTLTPIQEISYSLGFADPAYFNRFFRRQTGTTPGAFRERERRKLGV